MARENLAYDFSMFEPRQPREQKPRQTRRRKPLRVVKSRARSVRPAAVAKGIVAGAFVVASLFAVTVLNVRLNEENNQLTRLQKQYETAQSESVQLQMTAESRMSLKAVEEYAVGKLGMQKVQAGQISYIDLPQQDKVTVAKKKDSPLDTLKKLLVNAEAYFRP